MLARHQVRDQRLARRAVERAERRAQRGEQVDRPQRVDARGSVDHASTRGDERHAGLRHQHQPAPIERVGDHAAHQREHDDRHDAHQPDHAEREARGAAGTSSETCHRIAAFCIIEPAIETSWPVHSRRKLRWRSATSGWLVERSAKVFLHCQKAQAERNPGGDPDRMIRSELAVGSVPRVWQLFVAAQMALT